MARKKVTEHMIKQMQQLRSEGLKKADIGRKLGISRPTVFRYLRKDRNSYNRLDDDIREEIVRLRKERMGLNEIAALTKVSFASVQKIAFTAVKGMTIRPSNTSNQPPKKNNGLGRPSIPKETVDNIIELRKSGLFYKDIGVELMVSERTVANVCLKNKVQHGLRSKETTAKAKKIKIKDTPSVSSTISKETKLQIKTMYLDEGLTRTKIKDRLKLSFSTVDKILFEMDIDADVVKARKMKSIDPVKGKVKLRINNKTEIWVKPEKLEQAKLKYNLL